MQHKCADITEEWRPVPGYESRYEVSNLGTVRSLAHDRRVLARDGVTWGVAKWSGRALSPVVRRSGHLQVTLCSGDGSRKAFQLHALVLTAFVGPRPEGQHGCHYDGNPANNRLTNLRWDTAAANVRDTIRYGAHTRGERHGSAKLTNADIAKIVASVPRRDTAKLAHEYGVNRSTINKIRRGQAWKCAQPDQSANSADNSTSVMREIRREEA